MVCFYRLFYIMDVINDNKLNHLLLSQPAGTVFTASRMADIGISSSLQQQYRDSGWLESIGHGAMKRPKEVVNWLGALYSVQLSADCIHVGGSTALSLQGYAHYLPMGLESAYLFSTRECTLPAWYRKQEWAIAVKHIKSNFLPPGINLIAHKERDYEVLMSDPIRAMLECCYLVPTQFDFVEAVQVMEGLRTLSPQRVQQCLQASSSVKANRIFLFAAHRAQHSWLKYVRQEVINLGKGKRQIVPNGLLDPQFLITVPKELAR